MRQVRGYACAGVLAAALVSGALAGPARAQEMSMGQAMLVRSLLPSVVNITARAEIGEPPEPMMASGGAKVAQSAGRFQVRVNAGSGFIIDPSGEIATNWHVVDSAYEIYVTFADGTRARAELLNAAPLVDLAVIKVNVGHKLTAAHWANSDKVQIGDPVLAIGNPLGVGMSVSAGIVSALNRNIMDTPYDDFIQTDAAINHGNSGGPLFNAQGEVIGVNSAIISPTAANAGLGFSMPANDARFIFERLTHKGWLRPGYIGVRLQQVTPEMAAALGMKEPQGSIVADVNEGSAADRAGLRNGDVIVRFGTTTPSDERALLRAIARTDAGTSVPLGVLRRGEPIEVPVKVEEWPVMWWEGAAAGKAQRVSHTSVPPDLGLAVAPMTHEMTMHYEPRPEASGGLVVTGVLPGTDASQRGIAPGDVIEQVGDIVPQSPEDVQKAIDSARAEKRGYVLFLVMRKNQSMTAAQHASSKWIALRVEGS
jgi:serine protease Do